MMRVAFFTMPVVVDPHSPGIQAGTRSAFRDMEFDYVISTYVVMVLAYGLSTITLARQGWGGRKPRGRVVMSPGRRPRFSEGRRYLAHAS
jgi:hypothetical protein